MSVGERIKLLRKALGLNRKSFGNRIGRAYRTIQDWERGVNQPTISTVNRIARIFGVNPDWLLKGEGEMFLGKSNAKLIHDIIELPIIARVGAGYPVEQGDVDVVGYIHVRASDIPKGAFAVEVNGDSMMPTLEDKDIVIAKEYVGNAFDIPNNKIVVVRNHDGELLIKRIKKVNNYALLMSDNPAYEPILPSEDYKVIGIATQLVKVVKL